MGSTQIREPKAIRMSIVTALRLLMVMILWALCFPLITVGLNLAPHLAFAALRAAVAGIFLCVLAILLHLPLPRGRQVWLQIIVVSVATTSLGFLGMFHAAEFLSPGIATVIANVQPLLAAALAHAFLGERLTALGKGGLLVGFVGIVAISWSGLVGGEVPGFQLGTFYIGLALVGVAVGNIGLKNLAGKTDPVVTTGLQFVLGAFPLAVVSFFVEDISSISWSSQFVVILLVLAILGTAVAYWMWFTALAEVSLSKANAFTYLVPLFGLAIGVTLFDERIRAAQITGVALILLATYLTQLDFKSRLGKGAAD